MNIYHENIKNLDGNRFTFDWRFTSSKFPSLTEKESCPAMSLQKVKSGDKNFNKLREPYLL